MQAFLNMKSSKLIIHFIKFCVEVAFYYIILVDLVPLTQVWSSWRLEGIHFLKSIFQSLRDMTSIKTQLRKNLFYNFCMKGQIEWPMGNLSCIFPCDVKRQTKGPIWWRCIDWLKWLKCYWLKCETNMIKSLIGLSVNLNVINSNV